MRARDVASCLLLIVIVLLIAPLAANAQRPEGFSARRLHIDDGGPARAQKIESQQFGPDLPYHFGETLMCADCHTMHASAQHNYAGNTGPEGNIGAFPWSTMPTSRLLKYSDPLDLCLSCHDNKSNIPDVVLTDANALTERSAGYFDGPEITNARGHDLGRALPSDDGWGLCMRCHWGDPSDQKVTCVDCHDPHGNGNPRNLQWASDPSGTPPLGLFNPTGGVGMSKYERSNTTYGTLNTVALREVTNICIDCHHVLTGQGYNDPDGNDIHSRHPSYESERSDPNHITDGAARGSSNPAHWEGGVGSGFVGTHRVPFVVDGATDYATGLQVDASLNGVFCLSCHKAHGSSSPFGLVWEVTGDVNRKGCDQCHAMEPLP